MNRTRAFLMRHRLHRDVWWHRATCAHCRWVHNHPPSWEVGS